MAANNLHEAFRVAAMSVQQPDPRAAGSFRFLERGYDPQTGEARLAYALDQGPPLVETLRFPWAPWPVDATRQAALLRALDLLHLVAGVSYWKTAAPSRIDLGDHRSDRLLASFLTELYEQGLAEFAFVNQLDLAGRIDFGTGVESAPVDTELALPARALVAMGGGKDSLVALELLRAAGLEAQPVTVGGNPLIADTVAASGLPLITVRRQLAPGLAELNRVGAWNGHVPVTAINSAILLCAAILYGYRFVVFANERSADEATVISEDGRPVNHQYSKSLGFERGLRKLVRHRVGDGLEYFSLLRPLWEVGVAQRFSSMTRYHEVFSSCNRNFHQDGSRITGRWCGNCPKCRFTYLALAPHLGPDGLRRIFGSDLLADPRQEPGFRALADLGERKPFECVGTVRESRALLAALAADPRWLNHVVIEHLGAEIGPDPSALSQWLAADGPHCVPPEVLSRVDF